MRIILHRPSGVCREDSGKTRRQGRRKSSRSTVPLDPPNGKFDPVKQKALALGIPVRQHKSFKAPEVCDEFVALNADLAVLAFVTQIVPPQVFSVPKLGSICFHPSLLAQVPRRQRDQLGADQRRMRSPDFRSSGSTKASTPDRSCCKKK